MPSYNYWGLTVADIIQSFNGATGTDFATNSQVYGTIVNREMDFYEGDIASQLSKAVLFSIRRPTGIQVQVHKTSGVVTFPEGLPLEVIGDGYGSDEQDIKIYGTTIRDPFLGNGIYSGVDINYSRPSEDLETAFPVAFTATGTTVTVTSPNANTYYYASYNTNLNAISLPSLALILRNAVCCSSGANLYSREGDEWALVTTYCELSSKEYDRLAKFIPTELLNARWLVNPFNRPFTSTPWFRA
jgi:hypothetical protein